MPISLYEHYIEWHTTRSRKNEYHFYHTSIVPVFALPTFGTSSSLLRHAGLSISPSVYQYVAMPFVFSGSPTKYISVVDSYTLMC